MKTDDRDTTEGKGSDGDAENVIRLPRDWVGPPEELAPVGSRADAQRAERAARDSEDVPAASDFWSGGAGALHGAIEAPCGPRLVDRDPTDVRGRHPRPRVRLRRPARRPWGYAAPVRLSNRRPRARMLVALAVVVAVAAVAAIGLTEGGSRRQAPPTRAANADEPLRMPSQVQRETSRRPGSETATKSDKPEASRRAKTSHRRRAPSRTATGHRHSHPRRDRTSQARPAAQPTVAAQTTTTVTTTTTQPPSPPATTQPTATGASPTGGRSTSHTTVTHHSAFGAGGVLGAGHSSGAS